MAVHTSDLRASVCLQMGFEDMAPERPNREANKCTLDGPCKM